MSQESELNFRKMQENDLTSKNNGANTEEASISNYATGSYARSLTFIWQDGKKQSLNYSYLISCEYLPDANTITLLFTSHTVILKGIKLSSLFDDLVTQLTESISCVDARYNAMVEDRVSIVNEIFIHPS